ncbi:MAG: HAD-IB family hydrolase [Lentisphaerae bacterium]|nr:HAD-IB family hydrolase [Lentisphaerota bacterium]MCP4099892.1 HAD-IB family hydrolase [Lentisphaerota bacterium]
MREPKIYFFDMDHTLINNDCDMSWKEFVVAEKLAGPEALKDADYFYERYVEGTLPVEEFMKFQLNEFIGHTEQEMLELSEKHFQDFVIGKIYKDAVKEVEACKGKNIPIVLLSATNRIIAAPVAKYFGFDSIVAVDLEKKEDCFTGYIKGVYTMGEGKVQAAAEYCDKHGFKLEDAAYYGDSVNDVNILSAVGFPYVVNPVPALREAADNNNWPILSFK